VKAQFLRRPVHWCSPCSAVYLQYFLLKLCFSVVSINIVVYYFWIVLLLTTKVATEKESGVPWLSEIKLVLVHRWKENLCFKKNKIVSLPFPHQIFNFLSFIPKKQAHLHVFWRKQGCHVTYLGEGNKSIKFQSWHKELNCHVCSMYYWI